MQQDFVKYHQRYDELVKNGETPLRAAEIAGAESRTDGACGCKTGSAAKPPLAPKPPKPPTVAEQAYADKHGLDASKLTAEQKIKAVHEAREAERLSPQKNGAGADPDVKFSDDGLRSLARTSLITKHDPNFGTRNRS